MDSILGIRGMFAAPHRIRFWLRNWDRSGYCPSMFQEEATIGVVSALLGCLSYPILFNLDGSGVAGKVAATILHHVCIEFYDAKLFGRTDKQFLRSLFFKAFGDVLIEEVEIDLPEVDSDNKSIDEEKPLKTEDEEDSDNENGMNKKDKNKDVEQAREAAASCSDTEHTETEHPDTEHTDSDHTGVADAYHDDVAEDAVNEQRFFMVNDDNEDKDVNHEEDGEKEETAIDENVTADEADSDERFEQQELLHIIEETDEDEIEIIPSSL